MKEKKANNFRFERMRILAVAVLLTYALSFFQNHFLHYTHQQDHDHELHSAEQEQDPCHVAEYHQGQACGHETHVKASDRPCDLCQLLVTSSNDVEKVVTPQEHAIPSFELPFGEVWLIKAKPSFHFVLRGPPFIA